MTDDVKVLEAMLTKDIRFATKTRTQLEPVGTLVKQLNADLDDFSKLASVLVNSFTRQQHNTEQFVANRQRIFAIRERIQQRLITLRDLVQGLR